MFELKDLAPANMKVAYTRLETFQVEMSVLKFAALSNMKLMSVTPETSHLEMSESKADALLNILFIDVTRETSQSQIGPCGPSQSPCVDSAKHSLIAFSREESDSGEKSVRKGWMILLHASSER